LAHPAIPFAVSRPAVVPATGAGDTQAGGRSRRIAWRWGLLLTAGWLAQAGLRAWFGRGQAVPLANPDETAYLIAARVLAGGPGGNFSGSTLYQGGYPLLITPAYWLSHNPVVVYHTVLAINAMLSALLLPLGYLACRRLEVGRPAAYGVAMVTALLPAGFFYSEYAMTDAIFPVLMLAWLLATHSWLTAPTVRARYAAAAGSAALSGFAYTVHSRGLIMLAVYVVVAIVVAGYRLAPRGTVAVAGLTAAVTAVAGWSLDRYLVTAIYPDGIRSLSGQLLNRLSSTYGAVHVAEMAGGQLWRLTLDSWGLAGIGLIAALAAIRHRGLPADLRIMAAICVAVSALIACIAPAALPADQSQTWVSGRYLDGMIVTFFLSGMVVLLRARVRWILLCAAITAALTVLGAVTVAVYAGMSLPAAGFGAAFNFAEPAVLTQNWAQANVLLATAAAFGLLVCWIVLAVIGRRGLGRSGRGAVAFGGLGVGLAGVSLVALTQMTSHVSLAGTSYLAPDTTGMVTAAQLKPGDRIAIASDVNWEVWVPQTFEIFWTHPEFFAPASQPPAGVTVVETRWTAGPPATASWPDRPGSWRIVASDRTGGWVIWRRA
jgi:hypothetical protein